MEKLKALVRLEESLAKLPGVGRKTANVFLSTFLVTIHTEPKAPEPNSFPNI